MTPLSATVVTESVRGIEPPAEMWRTRAVMAETSYLFSQSESSFIAVVTHAGVIRAVLRTLCGLDEKTTWTLTKTHCCIFRYAHHSHPDRRLQEVLG
jgi:broad specificity phosphatase PhoE